MIYHLDWKQMSEWITNFVVLHFDISWLQLHVAGASECMQAQGKQYNANNSVIKQWPVINLIIGKTTIRFRYLECIDSTSWIFVFLLSHNTDWRNRFYNPE